MHLRQEAKGVIAPKLLAWYEREGRVLPWRTPPGSGETPDPYRVWLSEVMLQQTTVKAVLPRYGAFLRRWPTVTALAEAPLGDVLAEWAGLGYYARARNLHACAVEVAARHGGIFPDTEEGLAALPGIGGYTAAAIAAIAFGCKASPVDGNIERVLARLFALKTPLPRAKPEIKSLAAEIAPESRAGDFAQSMMDLGASICTPKRPVCGLCPLREDCAGYAEGIAGELPYREEKRARPTRRGTAYLVLRSDGAVLLRERPKQGLLGGMLEVPSSPWDSKQAEKADLTEMAEGFAPVEAEWRRCAGLVAHTFTHFHLELAVFRAELGEGIAVRDIARPQDCRFVARRDLHRAALPSVMRKVLDLGLNAEPDGD